MENNRLIFRNKEELRTAKETLKAQITGRSKGLQQDAREDFVPKWVGYFNLGEKTLSVITYFIVGYKGFQLTKKIVNQ